MKVERKSRLEQLIPTASMADIAFLLLIFFMVSTVFIRYRGLKDVLLPEAEKIEEIKLRRHITHIWVAKDGRISIDDVLISLSSVRKIIYDKLVVNPRLIVSLKCDRKAPYGVISDILEELRRVEALRINFAARRERKG